MAEFSQEYIQRNNIETELDFSIQYDFSKLKDNHQKYLCCEGFGFVGIRKDEGKCLLLYPDGKGVDIFIDGTYHKSSTDPHVGHESCSRMVSLG